MTNETRRSRLGRGIDRLGGFSTVVVAALAAAAGIAGSYAVAGFSYGFVVAPVELWLSNNMIDAVRTWAIQNLGSLGHTVNIVTALALTGGVFFGLVLGGIGVGRRLGRGAWALVPAVLVAGFAYAVTLDLLPSLAGGVSAGLVVAVAELVPAAGTSDPAVSKPRRRIVGGAATAVGLLAGGYLSGSSLPGGLRGYARGYEPVDGELQTDANRIRTLLAEADRKSMSVGGIEPLVSEDFYNVSIGAAVPRTDPEDWTLSVTGDVEESFEVDYEQLLSMQHVHRFETLRCVGEGLNGYNLDNALWTGVAAEPLLERAGPQGEYVVLHAADGYFEEFPLDALRGGMLAFGMNGKMLPRSHGHPVRALVPGHWGEINVKWLTEIEVSDEPVTGYWEQRGWHGTGPVNTVAKLYDEGVVHHDDGRIELGGHAYAGTRGIQRVEVSTDGGDTWNEADLSEPLPGVDVWRQYRYEYDSPGESHEVVVRAVDGEGNLQPRDRKNAFPSGATGWVSRTIEG